MYFYGTVWCTLEWMQDGGQVTWIQRNFFTSWQLEPRKKLYLKYFFGSVVSESQLLYWKHEILGLEKKSKK